MIRELNERTRHLLKVLIEIYIRDGQPVGSRTLSQESGLDLSPATIRNAMAELESFGLVASPHTSAGRIPTDKGYRMFVDSLLALEPGDSREIQRLKSLFEQGATLQGLAISVSGLLSGMTSMAGLVMVPRRERLILRHIEFVALSEQRVLAILMLNEHEAHNVVIHTGRVFTAAELERATNYMNTAFAGRDLADIRLQLMNELRDTRARMDRSMNTAILLAEQVFEQSGNREDVIVSGQTNLMEFDELSDLDRLRVLFEAFSEKRKILHLLDQCLYTQGVRVFIGKESGCNELDDCSVVTSTYAADGKVVGVLGVIGPTRMSYKRVIPLVQATAKLLTAALNQYH
ncbi:MAG: heat-inducible transcription repressor HrcA [Gammaproteobacteria bacterium]|nr:heat-inducible transcription repressor HrcA [Gammaproteobacteria bacterium]